MLPLNVSVELALVTVRVWLPSVTVPVPASDAIEVPVVAEISNVPSSWSRVEDAMRPLPDKASVPALIVAPRS